MPRNGSGVYSADWVNASPNTTIESAKQNAMVADLVTDANAARPVTAGGTGETTARLKDGTWRFQNTADTTKLLAFDLSGLTTATTRTVTLPDKSGTAAFLSDLGASAAPFNLGMTATVAANALTISIKGHNGNDPSATNPVYIPFRSVTAGSGDVEVLAITAATSLVISSGSTMGFTSAVVGRLWIVGFNDGGTFRLGAVNCLNGTSIMALRDGIFSSTAEGGAGGADTAQVIYTGTAVTSKAMTILGYLEATEATAGTWATAPSLVQLKAPGVSLPGEVVQSARTETGAVATGTTVLPWDDTIPQNTEGDQYMTQAITPRSEANLLSIEVQALVSNSAGTATMTGAVFRDTTAAAIAATSTFIQAATATDIVGLRKSVLAASTAATTFKLRAGNTGAGTTTFNGASAARKYGGVSNSFIEVKEIMT